MSATYWAVRTRGDPLAAVQKLVGAAWTHVGLDGLLVSANGGPEKVTRPRVIEDVSALKEINPFKPLMTFNIAQVVPKVLAEHPGKRLGVLLRPCEMRALVEMTKHGPLKVDNVLTICADCLGTFPADEYEWRVARKESAKRLTQEALQFARQGGIVAYRYRPACQVCVSPGARGADLNLNILGLPVRQQMLASVGNGDTAGRLKMADITDGVASDDLVQQHERALARLAERHRNTMERIAKGLGDILPQDVDALITQLENCGSCQRCMTACPICTMDMPVRSADGHYQRESIVRWLVSCAGCGMCEQACENQLPLSSIFGYIREQLNDELGYLPGRSVEDSLPL